MQQEEQALDLTVMIPSYLEAESLRDLLPKIQECAAQLTAEFEILVVDTQEPLDNTAEVCALQGVRHIRRFGGNNYGDAFRSGIAQARGKYILCMDADGSHNPRYFRALWDKREVWDIVIGSRYAKGGHTENPAVLIAMSYIVNLTFRIVFSISAKDVTNSFRLYRASVIKPIRLQSNAFDILEELLIRAVTHQPPARVGEVPVTFERRKAGHSKRNLVEFAFGYLKTLETLRSFQRDERLKNKAGKRESH